MTAIVERPVTTADPAEPAAPRRPVATPPRGTSGIELASVISATATMVAIVCLWLGLQLPFLSALSESRSQALLYPELRTDLASATAPTGGVIRPGRPVAVISVPTISLKQVVVEGTSAAELRDGPGHRRDTVLPGQVGVSVVYGRATTYGGPFSRITQIAKGDSIVVQMAQGRVEYVVDDVRRAGDPVPAAPATGQSRLTLVTAEGSGALAWLRPTNAVYVDATAKKSFPASPEPRPAIQASEQVMATDSSALPVLALCLAMLLGAAFVLTRAVQRWSRVVVWVVGTPVVLALAWFASDTVVRLLPNLM